MSFVSTAGQGKAILTVSRGASHFDFNFQKCFVIPPNSKMTAKILFSYAGWHSHLLQSHGTRPYSVRVESSSCCLPRSFLFIPESWCILIHSSRLVLLQPQTPLS